MSDFCTNGDLPPHGRGSRPGHCHECAMCYDEDYKLIPKDDPRLQKGEYNTGEAGEG